MRITDYMIVTSTVCVIPAIIMRYLSYFDNLHDLIIIDVLSSSLKSMHICCSCSWISCWCWVDDRRTAEGDDDDGDDVGGGDDADDGDDVDDGDDECSAGNHSCTNYNFEILGHSSCCPEILKVGWKASRRIFAVPLSSHSCFSSWFSFPWKQRWSLLADITPSSGCCLYGLFVLPQNALPQPFKIRHLWGTLIIWCECLPVSTRRKAQMP